MVETAGEEKNEAASPKRRQEAREKGNLPKSVDLSSAVVLGIATFVLMAQFQTMVSSFREITVRFFTDASNIDISVPWVHWVGGYIGSIVIKALAPLFAAISISAIVVGVLQSGLPTSLKTLQPDFSRLNPLQGMQRMVSARGFIELLKAISKVIILGWIGWSFIRQLLVNSSATYGSGTIDFLNVFYHYSGDIAKRLVMVFFILGAFDYGYQRWSYEKNLRMTTQELKEEMKETEGNPQIRSRIRQQMRQMSQRRMIQQVPDAQVVVVNPTHYAVALRYVPPMQAPKVVAKGADYMALKIREVAKKSHIPVVSNPPLARALYTATDLDQEIPGDLYQAVAEVLAYIYRLKHGITANR